VQRAKTIFNLTAPQKISKKDINLIWPCAFASFMAPDHFKLGQRMAMLMMMMMMGYLSAPNPFTHLGTKWV